MSILSAWHWYEWVIRRLVEFQLCFTHLQENLCANSLVFLTLFSENHSKVRRKLRLFVLFFKIRWTCLQMGLDRYMSPSFPSIFGLVIHWIFCFSHAIFFWILYFLWIFIANTCAQVFDTSIYLIKFLFYCCY